MFAGAPGEPTAFFTLRSEPFSLQTFPNGDVLIGLLGTEVFTFPVSVSFGASAIAVEAVDKKDEE